MRFIVTNAFSINMLPSVEMGAERILTAVVAFVPMDVAMVRELLDREEWESAVGHADTAAVFSDVLGVLVQAERVSVTLGRDVNLIVGQYRGPRLPEGATTLPAGAVIEWWRVSQM